MSPVELFAPILNNLSEEVANINEVFSKILAIKTEGFIAGESVRDIKMDICDIKRKFSSAITGMDNATKDLSFHEITVVDDMRLNRTSLEHNAQVVNDEM